jgi:MFS family permease
MHNKRRQLVVGCVLLGVAAIPDAMVVPVLKELTVDRFGVTEGNAHLFMAVNLLGALFAVGILALLNRRFTSSTLVIGSAALSATLMVGMATTHTWTTMLVLRCLEGGTDLVLLAVPLRIIASAGGQNRYAGRIGVGFTVMMVSLALGAGIGGGLGQQSAETVLWTSAIIMSVLFLIVVIVRRTVDNVPRSPRPEASRCPLIPKEWLGAGFLALDRGLAALVSTSLPILLASGYSIGPVTLGVALAAMFLALAIFAAPAGILADYYGGYRIRLIAALLSGFALTGLGLMAWLPPVVVLPPCLLVYGVGAAGLMPSAFSTAVRSEASNLVFGSLQAAGQTGYAAGVLGGLLIITVISLPADAMLSWMFPIAGLLFILLNCVLLFGIRVLEKRVA